MIIQLFFRLALDAGEHGEDERLHLLDRMRIAAELRKVPANIRLGIAYLLLQQVGLVEEEDDGHVGEYPVVDDGVENVAAFFQAIGLAVFEEHLIEFRRGHQKEYGGDFVEALEPLLSLRALPAHIDEQERHIVDGYYELGDAFGGFAAVQNVFVSGHIVFLGYPGEIIEEELYGVALKVGNQQLVKSTKCYEMWLNTSWNSRRRSKARRMPASIHSVASSDWYSTNVFTS